MTDLTELLKKAWTAVENAGLPTEIQPIAFREAIRILSPATRGPASTQTGARSSGGAAGGNHSGSGETPGSNGRVGVSEDEIYDRVVSHTGVDRDKLERLVHLDDDGPRVSLAGLKLGKNTSERARAVAQILTVARGFGLDENETSLEVIRTECDRLKVYDSANFSAHMKALSGFVINGSGQNRRIRAKGPGIAAFPGLVDSLLAES